MPRLERWEKQFVAVLAVLGLVLLGIVGYSVHAWHEATRTQVRPADLAKVAALTDLTFPAGAGLKRSHFIVTIPTSFLWAEVTIPAQEVESFKKAATEQAKFTWSGGYRMSEIAPKWMWKEGIKPPDWWHPESVRDGTGGSRLVGADGFTEVMMTQPHGGMATVYVQRAADG
jgi:hypothetical protein